MVSVQYTKSEKDRSTHSGATSRFESFIDELFVSSQRIYCSCMQGAGGKKISSEEKSVPYIFGIYQNSRSKTRWERTFFCSTNQSKPLDIPKSHRIIQQITPPIHDPRIQPASFSMCVFHVVFPVSVVIVGRSRAYLCKSKHIVLKCYFGKNESYPDKQSI